jgi:hypothetical protein
MSRPWRPAAITIAPAPALALALAAILAAGCGSAGPAGRPAVSQARLAAPSLATSVTTAAGTWAVAVLGGSAAQHNNFWQLFLRPAGSATWKLVTPAGVADNGGLVLAGLGGRSMIGAFRPSQYLTYTPLTATRDGGQAWSPAGPLDGALADAPDALAAAPGTGQLLALLADGTARLASPAYASWATTASRRSLARTPPGQRCGLRNLTAAAFSPSGIPLLAGTCGQPGTAGIFASRNGTWQAAGPALPAALARRAITVLRLARDANSTVALLAAGPGPATSLLAAWSADSGRHWALSAPLRLNGAELASASFGPGGTAAIVLTGNHGETVAGPGASWRSLPALPPGTATLAPGLAGGLDALAVDRTRLTVWQLVPGSSAWAREQAINVPIQSGSSA